MNLKQLLQKHKRAILNHWFDLLVESYQSDTATFIKSQKDPFHNPVGDTARKGLEALLDGVVDGMDTETFKSFLDPIIRIRAIQNFSPSQAVSFILQLKSLLYRQVEKELTDLNLRREYDEIASRIDDLCLLSFNIYMQCRETLYQIQADEVRNRTFKVLKRSGLLKEVDDQTDSPPL
ncbi:MAG: RsbRD N-terminal domain-containing protein [Desulfatirhabdiaceae bacterium]